MSSEVLAVPEEHLAEVIAVIEAGLAALPASPPVAEALTKWCEDERQYLVEQAADGD